MATARFDEDLLFTHRGLSGPAILQISSHWNPREPIEIDLLPGRRQSEAEDELLALKRSSRQTVANALATWLPRRLAEQWTALQGHDAERRIADVSDADLRTLAISLKNWTLVPTGTEGYRKAEVTRGGVATDELSQSTLEARKAPGTALHRRGGRRDGVAGRIQLSVGVGVRRGGRVAIDPVRVRGRETSNPPSTSRHCSEGRLSTFNAKRAKPSVCVARQLVPYARATG